MQMALSSTLQFGLPFISEFKIVLLGNREAGKTSLAHMILCRRLALPKRTAQCLKLCGVAAGRLMTIVDTPGWWKNCLVNETPDFQKQELVLSVTHCPPGPHAVLLVMRVDTLFKEKNKRSAVQHLELLGKGIWRHTLVVFTYGEHLQDQMVEQHMKSEGEDFLQELVNKCGNRYQVFNIDRYNGSQVRGLIEMIEEMVAGNSGCHYEMDRHYLYEVEAVRKAAHDKAIKKQLNTLKEGEISTDQNFRLSNVRIVLLGYRRAGKSSARNYILGTETYECKRTLQCIKNDSEVAGKLVTVLDTPGWWKTLSARDTPELDKLEILRSASLCPPGPHAFLLTLRADMPFTETERKSIEEHVNLLGEQVWNHTIILLTHGDLLGELSVEQYIEGEGKDLKLLIAKCKNRYQVVDNKNLVDISQVTELFQKIERMVNENAGQHFEMEQRTYKEVRRRWRLVEKKAKTKVKKRRGFGRPEKGPGCHLSKLSLVLLGYGEAGKTSASNTILDTTLFGFSRTSHCVRRMGKVAGRLLTVVDTPGWWKHLPVGDTPQLNKQEMIRSVYLTTGPVLYLLVLRLDTSFQEDERTAVEDHMRLFGRTVWDQTIVLFTCGDWLGDRSVDLYIESEGEALKWILEMCGNRYHVFNNKSRHGGRQVTELLKKIEKLVEENRSCHSGDMWNLMEDTETRIGTDSDNEPEIQKQNDGMGLDDDVFFADQEKELF